MAKALKKKKLALKKSVSGLGKRFSCAADRVADIIMDDRQKAKGIKAKEVTRETFLLYKDVRRQFRNKIQGYIFDAAYGMGKLSGKTRRTCSSLHNRLKRKKG